MTEQQAKSYPLKSEVGYYGRLYGANAVVIEHTCIQDTWGITIEVRQKESEVRGKSKPKQYWITDAAQVARIS